MKNENGNEEPLIQNERENELNENNENSLGKYRKLIKNFNKAIFEFDESMIKPFIIKSREIFNLKKEIKDQKGKLQKEIKNTEIDVDSEIIKLRDNYIKEKQGIKFANCIKKDSKIIILIFLSIFHFLCMLEIHGILFALFREIKRSIYFRIKEKYNKDDTKTFYDYLSSSSKNDSSKINLNYITSFLSDYFIAKTSLRVVYSLSIILNSIIILILLINDFLTIEQLNKGEDYPTAEFIVFIIAYIFIYIIASLISLYPLSLIQKLEKDNYWGILIITGTITLSAYGKNYLLTWNWYNDFKWSHNIILISCGLLFAIYLWICNKSLNSFYIDENIEKKLENLKEEEKIEKEELENNKNHDEIIVKKENKFPADYILGYLILKSDFSHIIINIKGFGGYLSSILKNWKIWFILFINFCSRAQKLKFKTDFKIEYNENIDLLSLNFLLSYILYVFIIVIICIIEKCKKRQNKEEINIIDENEDKNENGNNISEQDEICIPHNKNTKIYLNKNNKDNISYPDNLTSINKHPNSMIKINNYNNLIIFDNKNNINIQKDENSKLKIMNGKNFINLDTKNKSNLILEINNSKNIINIDSKNNIKVNNINIILNSDENNNDKDNNNNLLNNDNLLEDKIINEEENNEKINEINTDSKKNELNLNENSNNEIKDIVNNENSNIIIENSNKNNDSNIIINIDKEDNIQIKKDNILIICLENIKKDNNKKTNNNNKYESFDYIFREKAIILCIMGDDILMLIFSIISFFKKVKFFIYSSIVVSGAFNFFLYDYFAFSTAQGEYLTLSGIISVSQALFRLLEMFDSHLYLEEDFWYIIQSCISILELSYV